MPISQPPDDLGTYFVHGNIIAIANMSMFQMLLEQGEKHQLKAIQRSLQDIFVSPFTPPSNEQCEILKNTNESHRPAPSTLCDIISINL